MSGFFVSSVMLLSNITVFSALSSKMSADIFVLGGEKVILIMFKDAAGQAQAEQTATEKESARRELLSQIELEKKTLEQKIIANVDRVILPLLRRIEARSADPYVHLLERNLEELTSSFGRRIERALSKLTPREIEISNMIRNGMTCKKIARLLNVSYRTVETHRNKIREKLGLINKKISLGAYLKSL